MISEMKLISPAETMPDHWTFSWVVNSGRYFELHRGIMQMI